jgi:hypothetical protein
MILRMASNLQTGQREWILNNESYDTVTLAGLATLYRGKLPEVFANTEIAELYNRPAWQS